MGRSHESVYVSFAGMVSPGEQSKARREKKGKKLLSEFDFASAKIPKTPLEDIMYLNQDHARYLREVADRQRPSKKLARSQRRKGL